MSTFGDGVFLAALPLLAATLSRDPLRVSLVTFAGWLPWLLFGLVSGALVDRLDRRQVMWIVDAVRFALVGVLGVAVLAGWASIPLLAAVGFLLGVGETLFDNAAQSLILALVRREPQRLERANSQLYGAQTVSQRFLGPPAGGFLFALAAWVPFLVDAVSFAASATLIATIGGRFAPQRAAGLARAGLRADIAEGLRWLLAHQLLRALAVMVGLMNLATMAGQAILVLLAQEKLGLGSAGYGLLLTGLAVGGLLGSLVASRLSRPRRHRHPADWGRPGQGGRPTGLGRLPDAGLRRRAPRRAPGRGGPGDRGGHCRCLGRVACQQVLCALGLPVQPEVAQRPAD